MSEISERGHLILYVNKALSGAVTPNMRAVSIARKGDGLQLKFVFYVQPSEEEADLMGIVGTEVAAEFAEPMMLNEVYEVQASGPLAIQGGEIQVYRRKD